MGAALAGMSPASMLVLLLMAAGGALLYAAPARRYRTLGHAGLALGWALATSRYLGLAAGIAVGVVGLASTWLLDVGDDSAEEPLGTPMRLLLALFAAIAAAALMVARPLGAAGALDANAAWYWSGALGVLALLSERGARSTSRGGVLIVSAVALAALHLVPGPPLVLPLACALLVLAVGAAGRWPPTSWPLAAEPAGMLVDAVLAAAALGLIVGLAGWSPMVGEATFALGGARLTAAVAAALLGVGLAVHGRLVGRAGAVVTGWGALAAALLAILALSADGPAAAGVLAAVVPIAVVAGLGPSRGARVDGAGALLLVAGVAAACAGALELIAQSQASEAQPGLARVGLVLVLAHAALLGAIAPAHLWALGAASAVRAASSEGSRDESGQTLLVLAAVLGMGSLASLGLLLGAVQRYEWLLAVTGARPLVVGAALLGVALAGATLLAEERIGRLVVQVGALSGAVALLMLASVDPGSLTAFERLMTDRALALPLALVGADAVLCWRPGRVRSLARRLVRLDALPLWLGLGGLVGLPTAARLEGLAAVAADRPELAVIALASSVVGLVGVKRVADAAVTDAAEVREPDERPPAWRRLVPLVLSLLYVVYALA